MTGTVAPQLPEHWLTTHRNCGSAAPEYPKMERDILKKAAAYFARESLPGTRR